MNGEGFVILGLILCILSFLGAITIEVMLELKKKRIKRELYGGE